MVSARTLREHSQWMGSTYPTKGTVWQAIVAHLAHGRVADTTKDH